MPRFLTIAFFLLEMMVPADSARTETEPDREASTTTWTNEQGTVVRGNWSSGEVIEIRTVEDYYWHKDNYDPSAHYQVAPWLYDPFNLSRESGGDEGKN